ncbi:hypothetical protein C8R44DRAFT_757999 [Mycena epipterygia]|nr:hypothetical protein C8R44DRAFT_757999 [Mycena epipterygia]
MPGDADQLNDGRSESDVELNSATGSDGGADDFNHIAQDSDREGSTLSGSDSGADDLNLGDHESQQLPSPDAAQELQNSIQKIQGCQRTDAGKSPQQTKVFAMPGQMFSISV